MLYQLDCADLATRVRAKRAGRPLRAMVKEIGPISAATISRIENHKPPQLTVFLLLCNWLEVPPALLLHDLHHVGAPAIQHATATDLTNLELFIGLTPTVAFLSPTPAEMEALYYEARAAAEGQIDALFANLNL